MAPPSSAADQLCTPILISNCTLDMWGPLLGGLLGITANKQVSSGFCTQPFTTHSPHINTIHMLHMGGH